MLGIAPIVYPSIRRGGPGGADVMVIDQSRTMFATLPSKGTGDGFGAVVMGTDCPIRVRARKSTFCHRAVSTDFPLLQRVAHTVSSPSWRARSHIPTQDGVERQGEKPLPSPAPDRRVGGTLRHKWGSRMTARLGARQDISTLAPEVQRNILGENAAKPYGL
jgi:hypothetical protein